MSYTCGPPLPKLLTFPEKDETMSVGEPIPQNLLCRTWAMTKTFKIVCYAILFVVAYSLSKETPKGWGERIHEYVGPGPLVSWVSFPRKRERDGCSTSGKFEDPCVLDKA